MISALAQLKTRMFRPPALTEGTEFRLGISAGATAEDDSRWRVAAVRLLRGIPHAWIEHMTTGERKTVAVSALLGDRAFQFVGSARS